MAPRCRSSFDLSSTFDQKMTPGGPLGVQNIEKLTLIIEKGLYNITFSLIRFRGSGSAAQAARHLQVNDYSEVEHRIENRNSQFYAVPHTDNHFGSGWVHGHTDPQMMLHPTIVSSVFGTLTDGSPHKKNEKNRINRVLWKYYKTE